MFFVFSFFLEAARVCIYFCIFFILFFLFLLHLPFQSSKEWKKEKQLSIRMGSEKW